MKAVDDIKVGSASKDQYITNGLKVKLRVALKISAEIYHTEESIEKKTSQFQTRTTWEERI